MRRIVLQVQAGKEHVGTAVEGDGRCDGTFQAQAGQACSVQGVPGSIDVDGDMVVAVAGVKGVAVCVKLDGDEPVRTGVTAMKAEIGPAGGQRQPGRVTGEEESHAATPDFAGLDREGEPRGEAGDFAGGGVVERHRVFVRHPPRAILEGPGHGVTAGEVDQVAVLDRIALESEVSRAVTGSVGEVEAEGEGRRSGFCCNGMVGEEEAAAGVKVKEEEELGTCGHHIICWIL